MVYGENACLNKCFICDIINKLDLLIHILMVEDCFILTVLVKAFCIFECYLVGGRNVYGKLDIS